MKPKHREDTRRKSRGQSLVELAIVLAVLMFMLVGIVEYGFLLNRYLNLVDATREAARFGANINPFLSDYTVDPDFFDRAPPDMGIADLVEDFLKPVVLNPSAGDDIVISFFGVTDGNVVRFPDADGWSRNGTQVSKFSDTEIESRLDPSAPATGILLIEVFYHYPQTLNLPVFSNLVPNPIPVYTFAIMPLSAAEPTPTPEGP
jgi:hypothetical protein